MAEFYHSAYGEERRRKKRRRGFWGRLLDALATLLTVVVAPAMVMTYLVPHVHPAKVWFFPVLGPAAPAIYVATLLLALYWIIRWRKLRAGMMVLLTVIGFFYVTLFYKPQLRRDYGEQAFDRHAFKFISYNVRAFYGDDTQSSVDDVVRLVEEHDADIVCLQEFNARLADASERFARLAERYQSATFGLSSLTDSIDKVPMRIFSKFRILRSGTVPSVAMSVWADLLIGDDTVRVFSNHLRSTAIKEGDNHYIINRDFISDTAREEKLWSIVDRFRTNSVLRAAQVDSLAGFMDTWPGHSVVCGDFNDTPASYVYRTMARDRHDAFRHKGTGYSHTYRGFFNMLRIDYVLSSDDYEVVSYEVPQVTCSDHLPVVVRLKKR